MNKREENKKRGEIDSVKSLFKHLGVTEYFKGERPDFTFDFEGKRIGLELIRCLPTDRTVEPRKWRDIEKKIIEELNQSDLPPRLIGYGVENHANGKDRYKEIAKEIITAYQYMLDNNENSIYGKVHDGLKLTHLTHVSFYPDKILDKFSIAEISSGAEYQAGAVCVAESVKKKEKMLAGYKSLDANSAIQEYWLAVYIPLTEFCSISLDGMELSDSPYDRIYLINGRYDEGNEHHILRLK